MVKFLVMVQLGERKPAKKTNQDQLLNGGGEWANTWLKQQDFQFEISSSPATKFRQGYHVSSVNASKDPTTKNLKDIRQWRKGK